MCQAKRDRDERIRRAQCQLNKSHSRRCCSLSIQTIAISDSVPHSVHTMIEIPYGNAHASHTYYMLMMMLMRTNSRLPVPGSGKTNIQMSSSSSSSSSFRRRRLAVASERRQSGLHPTMRKRDMRSVVVIVSRLFACALPISQFQARAPVHDDEKKSN